MKPVFEQLLKTVDRRNQILAAIERPISLNSKDPNVKISSGEVVFDTQHFPANGTQRTRGLRDVTFTAKATREGNS